MVIWGVNPAGVILDAQSYSHEDKLTHAAAQVLEGDGYQAALVNFHYIANTVWTTRQVVKEITK